MEGDRGCWERPEQPLELPVLLPTFPTNLLTLKRGKLMLFLMKRVKFSASRRRAGLGKTALTHCPLEALVCSIELDMGEQGFTGSSCSRMLRHVAHNGGLRAH